MIELQSPYLIITDAKGVYAFQLLTRERWTRALSIVALHPNMELFKMVLTEEEANNIKFVIKKKLYMAAAYFITKIRLKRGDFVE